MSTFDGVIKEYPLISVDNYREDKNFNSTIYFLSHCHKDHMTGLGDQKFFDLLRSRNFSKIYLSDVSEHLLKNDPDYAHLSCFLISIPMEQPTIVTIPDHEGNTYSRVVVTLLTAGHCPGSVMFLFEGANGRVLYTGDFRLPVGGSARLVNLHDEHDRLKPLDTLYVDTTFCKNQCLYIPTREECLNSVITLVEPWLEKGSDHVVYFFCPAQYAYEFVFVELFKKFGVKTHVTEEKEKKYHGIKVIEDAVTSIPTEAQIHACIYDAGFIPQNILDIETPCGYYTMDHKPIYIMKIKPSAMFFQINEFKDIAAYDKYADMYRVCYSTHSSLSEVRDMVNYLRPKVVYPNVIRKQTKEEILSLILPPVHDSIGNHLENNENTLSPLGALRINHLESNISSPSDSMAFYDEYFEIPGDHPDVYSLHDSKKAQYQTTGYESMKEKTDIISQNENHMQQIVEVNCSPLVSSEGNTTDLQQAQEREKTIPFELPNSQKLISKKHCNSPVLNLANRVIPPSVDNIISSPVKWNYPSLSSDDDAADHNPSFNSNARDKSDSESFYGTPEDHDVSVLDDDQDDSFELRASVTQQKNLVETRATLETNISDNALNIVNKTIDTRENIQNTSSAQQIVLNSSLEVSEKLADKHKHQTNENNVFSFLNKHLEHLFNFDKCEVSTSNHFVEKGSFSSSENKSETVMHINRKEGSNSSKGHFFKHISVENTTYENINDIKFRFFKMEQKCGTGNEKYENKLLPEVSGLKQKCGSSDMNREIKDFHCKSPEDNCCNKTVSNGTKSENTLQSKDQEISNIFYQSSLKQNENKIVKDDEANTSLKTISQKYFKHTLPCKKIYSPASTKSCGLGFISLQANTVESPCIKANDQIPCDLEALENCRSSNMNLDLNFKPKSISLANHEQNSTTCIATTSQKSSSINPEFDGKESSPSEIIILPENCMNVEPNSIKDNSNKLILNEGGVIKYNNCVSSHNSIFSGTKSDSDCSHRHNISNLNSVRDFQLNSDHVAISQYVSNNLNSKYVNTQAEDDNSNDSICIVEEESAQLMKSVELVTLSSDEPKDEDEMYYFVKSGTKNVLHPQKITQKDFSSTSSNIHKNSAISVVVIDSSSDTDDSPSLIEPKKAKLMSNHFVVGNNSVSVNEALQGSDFSYTRNKKGKIKKLLKL